MRIKVMIPNENGKIELTPGELQQLLNEAYNQGWNDRPYNYGYLSNTTYANDINSAATSALQTNKEIK